MSATNCIRVLVRSRGTGTHIFRTLISLACQDIGPRRLEIVLAATDPDLHSGREARLLHSALDFSKVEVLDARGFTTAQALNQAAADGHAGHLALVPEGARLHPQFMSRGLAAMRGRSQPQVVFCEQASGSANSTPFSRRTAFRPEQLIRRNVVGPITLIQRTAWDILGGLHPGLEYNQWDFWLRLALAGGRLAMISGQLASCPPRRWLTPEQDGRAKALLVVHMPGAFEPDVCRWAMALLRGDPWATPFEPGVIPSPRDVGAMFAGLDMPLRPGSLGWENRQRWIA